MNKQIIKLILLIEIQNATTLCMNMIFHDGFVTPQNFNSTIPSQSNSSIENTSTFFAQNDGSSRVNYQNSVAPNLFNSFNFSTDKQGNKQRDDWLVEALSHQIKDDVEQKQKEIDCGCTATRLTQLDTPTQVCLNQKIDFTGHLLAMRQILLNRDYFRADCVDNSSDKPCQLLPDELQEESIKQSVESVNSCLQYGEEMTKDIRQHDDSLTQLNICLNLLQRNSTLDSDGIKDVKLIADKVNKMSKGTQVIEVISLSTGLTLSALKIIGAQNFQVSTIISVGFSFQSIKRNMLLQIDKLLLQKHKLIFNDIHYFISLNQAAIGLVSQKFKILSDFVFQYEDLISKVQKLQIYAVNGRNLKRLTEIFVRVYKNIMHKPKVPIRFNMFYNKDDLQVKIKKDLKNMFIYKKQVQN